MRRSLLLAGIAVGGVAAMAMPTAAMAANDSAHCYNVNSTGCTTTSIPAETPGHWVNYSVDAGPICGADWKVVDAGNGVTVGSGHVNRNSHAGSWIPGLYSRYYLRVYNSCPGSQGTISNFD